MYVQMYVREHILEQLYKVTMHTCLANSDLYEPLRDVA